MRNFFVITLFSYLLQKVITLRPYGRTVLRTYRPTDGRKDIVDHRGSVDPRKAGIKNKKFWEKTILNEGTGPSVYLGVYGNNSLAATIRTALKTVDKHAGKQVRTILLSARGF